ncbi:hypothetical protein Nm8I071_31660 [Nonomuraea sp. TT08I-71]|nr:hypothetical protein Nm8I071_31660 [Nonomuraea sp. TT08I-71]
MTAAQAGGGEPADGVEGVALVAVGPTDVVAKVNLVDHGRSSHGAGLPIGASLTVAPARLPTEPAVIRLPATASRG